MENKELTKESPKDDVAEFCKYRLGFPVDTLKIIINEFLSGDVLPFIIEQELTEIGFNLICRSKILKYVKKNKEKFKDLKFNEKILFNTTKEEMEKFLDKNLDFKGGQNEIDRKGLIKLKVEDMKNLGMKLGQRKRLRNIQKQILKNILKNIKELKELSFIFDNFCFKNLFYLLLNNKDDEYENILFYFIIY